MQHQVVSWDSVVETAGKGPADNKHMNRKRQGDQSWKALKL
jgi:hypothetical protein